MEVAETIGLGGEVPGKVTVLGFGGLADIAGNDGETRRGVGFDVFPTGTGIGIETEVGLARGGLFGLTEIIGVEAVVLGRGGAGGAAIVIGTAGKARTTRLS